MNQQLDPIDFFANFRRNLLLLRLAKGMTPDELGKEIGCVGKRITDFEYGKHGRGKPRTEELFKIGKVFDVSPEDLINKQAKIIL